MLKHSAVFSPRFIVTGVLLALGGAVSCDFKNPLEGVALQMNFAATETVGGIRVVDARTGEPLTVPATIRFSGTAASRVVDLAGDAIPASGATVHETGLMTFGITGAVPTAAAPARLTVNVRASGYVETADDINLDAAENEPRVIRLVSVGAPPEGSAAGTGSVTLTGGSVPTAVTIQTGAEAVTQGRTTITIPAGTVVRNSAGAPMSGTLSASVVHFNSISDSALAAFPGGLDARVENPPAGASNEVVFTPAGFAAITLTDQGGQEAKTFTQPLSVTIDVADETDNPVTGAKVKAGDVVPYWSFEASTGAWRYEGDVALTGPDANGNFKGSFNTTHLTYFNLDWYGSTCSASRLSVVGNPNRTQLVYTFSRQGRFVGQWWASATSIALWGVPRGPAQLVVRHAVTNSIVGTANFADLCANPSVTVNLPSTVSIQVDMKAVCANKAELRPNIYISARRNVGGRLVWQAGQWIYAGRGTISGLQPNTDYDFLGSGYYKGKWYQASQTMRSPASGTTVVRMSMPLTSEVC